jgi:hypothetical protein
MNKMSREIDCLARLDSLTAAFDSIVEYLKLEELMSKDDEKSVTNAQDKAKWLWTKLEVLSETNKLQLLEYSWELLPVERLKVVIVTDRNHKEFSYNF